MYNAGVEHAEPGPKMTLGQCIHSGPAGLLFCPSLHLHHSRLIRNRLEPKYGTIRSQKIGKEYAPGFMNTGQCATVHSLGRTRYS